MGRGAMAITRRPLLPAGPFGFLRAPRTSGEPSPEGVKYPACNTNPRRRWWVYAGDGEDTAKSTVKYSPLSAPDKASWAMRNAARLPGSDVRRGRSERRQHSHEDR